MPSNMPRRGRDGLRRTPSSAIRCPAIAGLPLHHRPAAGDIDFPAPILETSIVAMTDHVKTYDYRLRSRYKSTDGNIEDYVRAADFLNAGRFDTVCLQHESEFFGGEAGAHILVLLSRLTMPAVTTLHTVLAEPPRRNAR